VWLGVEISNGYLPVSRDEHIYSYRATLC